jgi:hypothetical protein
MYSSNEVVEYRVLIGEVAGCTEIGNPGFISHSGECEVLFTGVLSDKGVLSGSIILWAALTAVIHVALSVVDFSFDFSSSGSEFLEFSPPP